VASHLSDIGFRAQAAGEWEALVRHAVEHGQRLEVPGAGAYLRWAPGADAHLVQLHLVLPSVVTLQVAAFAHELACYTDEAAYFAAQEREVRFAAESLIPTGLFALAGEGERAEALFAGRVLRTEVRTNPASGAAFHALLVRTLGGCLRRRGRPGRRHGRAGGRRRRGALHGLAEWSGD
jgi:hypothetical protein